MPAWIIKTLSQWERVNIITIFPQHTSSLNNAFSILQIVWQTHGFVVHKLAFQHVIINNSFMTNSYDIYTALSVCMTLTEDNNKREGDWYRERHSVLCTDE